MEVLLPSGNLAAPTSLARKNCRNEKNCRKMPKISAAFGAEKSVFVLVNTTNELMVLNTNLFYRTQLNSAVILSSPPSLPTLCCSENYGSNCFEKIQCCGLIPKNCNVSPDIEKPPLLVHLWQHEGGSLRIWLSKIIKMQI